MKRKSWDIYFMDIAYLVASRSTCLRRQVGAVAVVDHRILATGYNGAPSGCAHCLNIGCVREQMGIPSGERHEICRASHAEMNIIAQAALYGISLKGATIYCTNQPCSICTKLMINSKISRIIFENSYPDALATELFTEASSGTNSSYVLEVEGRELSDWELV